MDLPSVSILKGFYRQFFSDWTYILPWQGEIMGHVKLPALSILRSKKSASLLILIPSFPSHYWNQK
jgi:hypothetical protein